MLIQFPGGSLAPQTHLDGFYTLNKQGQLSLFDWNIFKNYKWTLAWSLNATSIFLFFGEPFVLFFFIFSNSCHTDCFSFLFCFLSLWACDFFWSAILESWVRNFFRPLILQRRDLSCLQCNHGREDNRFMSDLRYGELWEVPQKPLYLSGFLLSLLLS